MKTIPFNTLNNADLIIDALYKGGVSGNMSDEPVSKLLGVSNQGGFRYIGSTKTKNYSYVMLYTSLQDLDWPDQLNKQTGQFIYFGDNKQPGNLIHETVGNIVLRDCFNFLHMGNRSKIPPFFVFSKAAEGRDVIFRGIAAPGEKALTQMDDLVAVWKSRSGERFQNYKAAFTILDIPTVSRSWLKDLQNNNPLGENCPEVWRLWVEKGIYTTLEAERIIEYRSKEEQIPSNSRDIKVIKAIHSHFKDNPFAFEKCAVEIVRMMDKNFTTYDLTRPWVDGGRDAIGKYNIGFENNSIYVDYALEAKCYSLDNSVGVRETSRLISRLRHRQFGVFVTTSYVHRQAYKEIKDDGHPMLILSAIDIVEILKRNGYSTPEQVIRWVNAIVK